MEHRFARRAIEIGGLVPSAPKYDLVILNSCKKKTKDRHPTTLVVSTPIALFS
jgi:hypothetical protein